MMESVTFLDLENYDVNYARKLRTILLETNSHDLPDPVGV